MTVRRWAAEEQVNGDATGPQGDAVLASLPGGGFVVAWMDGSDPLRSGVRFQIYDSAGQPLGEERGFVAASASLSDLSIVALAGGGFVIGAESWAGEQRDAQLFRFDAEGVALGLWNPILPAAWSPRHPSWPRWVRDSWLSMRGTAISWSPGMMHRAPSWGRDHRQRHHRRSPEPRRSGGARPGRLRGDLDRPEPKPAVFPGLLGQ